MLIFKLTDITDLPGWLEFIESLSCQKNKENYDSYTGFKLEFLNQELEPWDCVACDPDKLTDPETELVLKFTEEGYLAFKLRWK